MMAEHVNGWRIIKNIPLGFIEFLHITSFTKFTVTNHILASYGLTVSDVAFLRRGVFLTVEPKEIVLSVNRSGSLEVILSHHFPPLFDLTLMDRDSFEWVSVARNRGNTLHYLENPTIENPFALIVGPRKETDFIRPLSNDVTIDHALVELDLDSLSDKAIVIHMPSIAPDAFIKNWFDTVGHVKEDGYVYLEKGVVEKLSLNGIVWNNGFPTLDQYYAAIRFDGGTDHD